MTKVKYNMNKTIFFSLNHFYINNENIFVNKNNSVVVEDYEKPIEVRDDLPICNSLKININDASSNLFLRCGNIESTKYIELISCNFLNIKQKFVNGGSEVLIFENSVLIFYNNLPYTYYFRCDNVNYCTETENSIFVFNGKYFVIFNKSSQTFTHYIVENLGKIDDDFELVCRLPKNINYFIYFNINLKDKKIINKKLKKPLNSTNSAIIPHIVFYLAKNNFKEIKLYLNNEINYEKLIQYFSNYDNIFEIQNKYFVTNCREIKMVSFKIENNLLVDVD